MNLKKKYSLLLSVLGLILILQSCTIEKKLGKQFLEQTPQICIQVFAPATLYKFSHKGEKIAGFDSLTGTQQDSVLFAGSRYIKVIDDSVFLDKYVNSFIDGLRAIGFRVFIDDNVDTILNKEPQAYVVNMSQIQLDEYIQPYDDSEQVDDSLYKMSFDLNAVDASSWFELNKYNSPKSGKTVLYSSFTASDGFSGNFIINGFGTKLQYRYKIDSLQMKDIYDLASYTGRQDANYLYDYFMNQFIAYNMPKDWEMLGYLHYLPSNKSFNFTEEELFEVLPDK